MIFSYIFVVGRLLMIPSPAACAPALRVIAVQPSVSIRPTPVPFSPARLRSLTPAPLQAPSLAPSLAAPRLEVRPLLSPSPAAPLAEAPAAPSALGTARALESVSREGFLESSLAAAYDGGKEIARQASFAGEDRGALAPQLQLAPARARESSADRIRAEYKSFLGKLGFRSYTEEIDETLKDQSLTKGQRAVLKFNQSRYGAAVAGRDLAVEVMAGLSEQRFSKEAMEQGTELAARLLTLQPLDPPATLPAEVAKKSRDGIVKWLGQVTTQKLSSQLAQVVSDVIKVTYGDRALKPLSEALAAGRQDPETRAFAERVTKVKGLVETILVSNYTDAELGQTRYAGRALAAAITRFSRLANRPEVEERLAEKAAERGLRLENFVGDTLMLKDASGKTVRLKIETGDVLGERSGGREASEITFAVRPPYSLWLKAWRKDLLGSKLGLWANPKGMPKLVAGQDFRNKLKMAVWHFKKWLAGRPALQKGYSHVGLAKVDQADGIAMVWAVDNYPNAEEGGIRKIGVVEQYAQNGPYIRLGFARLDAERVWDDFSAQAAKNGYREQVYEDGGFKWPSRISREDFERLRAIPRSRAAELLRELNDRAAAVLEEMITRWGVSFAYGFANDVWRAYCSATVLLAYRMGGQYELQSAPDVWHPIVRVMKLLGLPGAKDQEMSGRIIWPGSFFVDPKVGEHKSVTFPKFTEAGKLPNPYTIPAYVEMDPKLTRSLASLVTLTEGNWEPDSELIEAAVRLQLDSRAQKGRAQAGIRSNAAQTTGYSAGLEELLSPGDDD